MAQTKNKYQIIQKVSENDTVLLHPETQADVVEYNNTQSGLSATTVQGAIDELSSGAGVTGVKGNNEQSYRTGNVNITAANIGAEEVGAVGSHNSSNTAHSDIRQAVSSAQSRADEAYSLAEGRSRAESFEDIETFVYEYNNNIVKFKRQVGDAIYIQTLGVPDLWIYSADSVPGPYTYTTDEAFVNALKTQGSVQVGYYHFSALETDKVDLTEYQKKTDNSLGTTSKTVVGAINEVKSTADTASSTASANASEIANIKNGTTKVGSATSADSASTAGTATEATSATKWKTARTIGVSVNSGTKANGSTAITGSGSQSVDGQSDKTISVTLGDSGVSAGTYSAVQVNAKGIAVAGGQMIEVGTSGQTTPSNTLATGGLFFKLI